jgi:hypothetical protein
MLRAAMTLLQCTPPDKTVSGGVYVIGRLKATGDAPGTYVRVKA